MLHHRLRAASGARKTGGGGGGIDPLGDDFVLVVDTTLPSADLTTTLAWYGPYDLEIDWGDGTVETYTKAIVGNFKIPHTYPNHGQYKIRVSGTAAKTGFGDVGERYEWLSCESLGRVTSNFTSAFARAQNLVSLPERIPSGIQVMQSICYQCLKLNCDISGWDVSQVNNMMNAFGYTYEFDSDLSGWCVPFITSEPSGFATKSALQPQHYPIWGTCPA